MSVPDLKGLAAKAVQDAQESRLKGVPKHTVGPGKRPNTPGTSTTLVPFAPLSEQAGQVLIKGLPTSPDPVKRVSNCHLCSPQQQKLIVPSKQRRTAFPPTYFGFRVSPSPCLRQMGELTQ